MRKSRSVAIVALVFIAEVLAGASYIIWARERWSSEWVAIGVMIAAILVWNHLATPRGWLSGPVVTPVSRALLNGLAVVALWDAGHGTLAVVQACLCIAAAELLRVPGAQEMLDRAHGVGKERKAAPVTQPG